MPNKSYPRKEQDSHAPSVFATEIDGFTAKSKLSRRESDIVLSLIRNITNSEEIAKSLGISTHTVNNHLKSIFEKTTTKSKTEILSSFLRFAADRLQSRGLFMRRPRVLVIDDEELICEYVVAGLRERGARAYPLTDPRKVVEVISKLHIDFVVCDIRMPTMNGMDVLKEVRRVYRCWPYFLFITGYPDFSLEECMDQGAAGFIEKPLDVDRLFRIIMSHIAESPEERYQLLQLQGVEPIVVDDPIKLTGDSLGYGGAFIPADSMQARLGKVQVGSVVDMTLEADKVPTPFKARGLVVWKRTSREKDLRPGVGVRFIDLTDKDQEQYDSWLRTTNPEHYIPLGR